MIKRMLLILSIALIAAFALGWSAHGLFASKQPVEVFNVKLGDVQEEGVLEERSFSGFAGPVERPSPADRLTPWQVRVFSDRVIIEGIPGRSFETAVFTDTNSMDPLIDEDSQAIQIVPLSPKEIKVGDIISYDAGKYGIIIHRVVGIGFGEQGWYAITKGDNNPAADPGKVRFSQVRRVLVGVLY